MPAQNQVPAWPFAPNWRDGIMELLEWKTTILTSPTGAEQRYANRASPRRMWDMPFLLHGMERSYLDTLLMQFGAKEWFVPIAHEQVWHGPVLAGQAGFTIPDTASREFRVGGAVILRGRTAFEWDVGVVTSMNEGSISLAQGVQLAYPDGCRIFPAFLGRITDTVTAQRHTARVYEGTVRFMAVEPTVWPVQGRALSAVTLYSGALGDPSYPVLVQPPNAVEALDYTWERMLTNIDNEAAIPRYTDSAKRAFTGQKYTWFLRGSAQRDFRDLLFRLQGRRGAIWVPTFNDDLAPGGSGWPNPGVRIQDIQPGRERAIIYHNDGTSEAREVMGDGTTPPYEAFGDASIKRTSLVTLKRLDTDSIEIMHQTGREGLDTVSAIFRDAPDLRVSTGYLALPYPKPYKWLAGVATVVTSASSDLNAPLTVGS